MSTSSRRALAMLAYAAMCVLSGATIVSCSPAGESPGASPGVRVVASIPPIAGLLRDALPEGARVDVLIPAGVSPHGFESRPADLAILRRADLVVLNGLGVETGVGDMVASTDRPGRDELVLADIVGVAGEHVCDDPTHDHSHDHASHDGDEDGEHAEHGALDPHLWLDPSLAAMLVERVGQWGEQNPARHERVADLLARIAQIDAEYHERLAPYSGRSVITDHRAWDRLLARYGLSVAGVIRPIEHVEPSPGVLASVIETVRTSGASAVFVEPQFAGGPAERIADATNIPIGRLDPLGSGDWFAMMRTNLDEIERTLSLQGVGGP